MSYSCNTVPKIYCRFSAFTMSVVFFISERLLVLSMILSLELAGRLPMGLAQHTLGK